MKARRGTKGFTLIELLIVIAIIGILAAIAIPAYTGYTAKAKVAGVIHSMGAVKNAVAAYYVEAAAAPDAADAAAIKTLYGIDVPSQYVSSWKVQNNGEVYAMIANINGDVNGKTILLTPTWASKTWAWGGDIDASYRPKG